MASRLFHLTAANSVNLTQIGDTGAKITGVVAFTTTNVAAFLKFWWGNSQNFSSNKDTPTVGTDVPELTIPLPAGSGAGVAGAPITITWTGDAAPRDNGNLFMALTLNAADTDNTAVAANAAIVSVSYQ